MFVKGGLVLPVESSLLLGYFENSLKEQSPFSPNVTVNLFTVSLTKIGFQEGAFFQTSFGFLFE